MGGLRNENDVSLMLTIGLVVASNSEQAGELTLRTCVRLHRNFRIPGDFREPLLHFVEQRPPPGGLRIGRIRVHVGELRPGDWLHAGGRVQLHGARPQRDHGAIQRQILVLQLPQVAQHLGLRMHRRENGVRQGFRGARQRQRAGLRLGCSGTEQLCELFDVLPGGALTKRHRNLRIPQGTHQVAGLCRGGHNRRGITLHRHRVEKVFVHHLIAHGLGEIGSILVHPLGNRPQTGRTMPNGVHGGAHRQQRLGGTNITGGPLPANMLLPGL